MQQFIADNFINIFFSTTTIITSALALRYKRLEHRKNIEALVDDGRKAGLFLSREAMICYLLEMYDRAERDEVIWAQCIRCTDFTPGVRRQILEAAGRGVRFQMIVNQYSPTAPEFRSLFQPIEGAEVFETADNALPLQGLSNREVVVAFPGVENYTAVVIRDEYFVSLIRRWFLNRVKRLR